MVRSTQRDLPREAASPSCDEMVRSRSSVVNTSQDLRRALLIDFEEDRTPVGYTLAPDLDLPASVPGCREERCRCSDVRAGFIDSELELIAAECSSPIKDHGHEREFSVHPLDRGVATKKGCAFVADGEPQQVPALELEPAAVGEREGPRP